MSCNQQDIVRIACILADDPDLSNAEMLQAIKTADHSVEEHRRARKAAPFEVYRVRRILALAIAMRFDAADLQ